jgi:hypothetical protein
VILTPIPIHSPMARGLKAQIEERDAPKQIESQSD